MSAPPTPDPARTELEIEKLRLETAKLRLEAGELGRPQWRRAAVLIPAAIAVVSTASFLVQFHTSNWKAEKASYELMLASAKKDSVERERKVYEARIDSLRSDSARLTTSIATLQKSNNVLAADVRDAQREGAVARAQIPGVLPGADTAGARQAAIAGLFAESPSARGRSYDVLIGRYANAPDLVPAVLAYADSRRADWGTPAGQNGVYNTLVLLSHLDRGKLAPHTAAIRAFAAAVRAAVPRGAKIQERVDVLLSRLPQ